MAAETGHLPNRSYIDQNGNFHLNGAQFLNDAEADIADSLESLNSLAPAELGYIDGVTAGTVTASKAVVVDANKDVASLRNVGLTGVLYNSVASVAAAGSSSADAAAMSTNLVLATGADGTKGVRLPASVSGAQVMVINNESSQTLKVYPPSGGTINGGSADAAYSMLGGRRVLFLAASATAWHAVETTVAGFVVGAGNSYKIACGETALDGSNPTSVAHGLTTCVSFVAMLKGTSAPGLGTSTLISNINGANVDVYAWKPTSNSDPTLIASTGTESFYWIAVGT